MLYVPPVKYQIEIMRYVPPLKIMSCYTWKFIRVDARESVCVCVHACVCVCAYVQNPFGASHSWLSKIKLGDRPNSFAARLAPANPRCRSPSPTAPTSTGARWPSRLSRRSMSRLPAPCCGPPTQGKSPGAESRGTRQGEEDSNPQQVKKKRSAE